jgi:hypothetical protein
MNEHSQVNRAIARGHKLLTGRPKENLEEEGVKTKTKAKVASVKKATPEPKKAATKDESPDDSDSDDEGSSEDGKPKRARKMRTNRKDIDSYNAKKADPAKKEAPKGAAAKKEETSDDEDSCEAEKPAAKKAKAAVGKAAKTKKADSDNAGMKTKKKRKAPEAAEGSKRGTPVFRQGKSRKNTWRWLAAVGVRAAVSLRIAGTLKRRERLG